MPDAASGLAARRLRFDCRSLEVDALRLCFSRLGELDREVCDVRCRTGRGGRAGGFSSEEGMADSGTRRRVDGSIWWELLRWGADSCFGKPRAAAAQERRVDRLARRAASWSAWCAGESML